MHRTIRSQEKVLPWETRSRNDNDELWKQKLKRHLNGQCHKNPSTEYQLSARIAGDNECRI